MATNTFGMVPKGRGSVTEELGPRITVRAHNTPVLALVMSKYNGEETGAVKTNGGDIISNMQCRHADMQKALYWARCLWYCFAMLDS